MSKDAISEEFHDSHYSMNRDGLTVGEILLIQVGVVQLILIDLLLQVYSIIIIEVY